MRVLLGVFCAILATTSAQWHGAIEKGQSKVYCLIAETKDTLGTIQYEDSETKQIVNYKFNMSGNEFTGNCAEVKLNQTIQTMRVSFVPNNVDIKPIPALQKWDLTLTFAQDQETSNGYKLVDYSINAVFYREFFNSTQESILYEKAKTAEDTVEVANQKNIFSCSTVTLALTNSSNIALTNFKVLAFASAVSTDFPKGLQYEMCARDARTSDIVPIIVGACLAGLVIVVLIAYLIGRARAKRQGYASV